MPVSWRQGHRNALAVASALAIPVTSDHGLATIQNMEFDQFAAKIKSLEADSKERIALAERWPDHEARIQVGLGHAKNISLKGHFLEADFARDGKRFSQDELNYMSDDQASMLAGMVFMKLFPRAVSISEDDILEVEEEDGSWSGTVYTGEGNGWVFSWVIEKKDDIEFLISFSDYENEDEA